MLKRAPCYRYASYFWWREYYEVRNLRVTLPLCDLCQKLHDANASPSSYPDLSRHWWDRGQCQTLRNLTGKEGSFRIVPLSEAPNRTDLEEAFFKRQEEK